MSNDFDDIDDLLEEEEEEKEEQAKRRVIMKKKLFLTFRVIAGEKKALKILRRWLPAYTDEELKLKASAWLAHRLSQLI